VTLKISPLTLTIEFDLDGVTLNQHAKYVGQRSCGSKDIAKTHRHTDIHRHTSDRLLDPDH